MAAQDICRLSELPESLLCSNILPLLPLTDAVRFSLLCSKWRYHWTKIPHLHFSPRFFSHMSRSVRRRLIFNREAILHIKETMEHILIHHEAPLECFLFYIPSKFFRNGRSRSFIEAMDIEQCIDYVAKKEVKQMFLEVVAHTSEKKMSLPITVFGCTTLLRLQLVCFIIPEIPTLSENFKLLRACLLCNIENLNDHSLQRLVELCPVLEKLVLINCRELTHLKVQAANLKCLVLAGCPSLESVTADCPQLLQLKARKVSRLYELQINSYSLVELNIRDCYELAKLQLNSCVLVKRVGSVEGLSIRGHSDVESLRKLSLEGLKIFPKLEPVGIFPGLEELRVSPRMLGTAVERGNELEEKVEDFMFPKLNNVYVDISDDESEVDLARLGFLLRSSPLLKTLTLNMSYCPEDFKNQLLGLKRESVEIKILNENKDQGQYSEEREGLDRCGYFWYKNEGEESEDEDESDNEMSDVEDDEDYYDNYREDYEVFEDYDYPSG